MNKGSEAWKNHNRPICKEKLREHLDNPFIRDIREIQSFCYEHGVDVGVGLDMYLNKYYPTKEDRETINLEQLNTYKEIVREYYLDFIVECLDEIVTEEVTTDGDL